MASISDDHEHDRRRPPNTGASRTLNRAPLQVPATNGDLARQSEAETVADQIVSAVVPIGRRLSNVGEKPRALPLGEVHPLPRDGTMHYRIAAVDHRGRMAGSSLMRVLGWMPGDRVDVATTSGVVVVRRNDYGAFSLTRRGHVQLPLAVRRWCGVTSGDRVLLAAAPDLGVLVVHTMAVLDEMIVAYYAMLAQHEQR